MLPIIAWRNIWRSRTRSLVVIGSIIIGVWALVFLLGFFRGQVDNYITNIIQNETSHVQFHDSLFKEDFDVRLFIPEGEYILADVVSTTEVKTGSSRILVNGMLSSSNAAQGVLAKGVHPDQEQVTTGLYDKVIEGEVFDTSKRNQIMISERIADKLKVKMRSKVVLTFQNAQGDISAAAFRVSGIYKTHNRMNDELYVFAYIEDLRRLTMLPGGAVHELALILNHFDSTDTYASRLGAKYKPYKVETYKQISPDLELFNSQIRVNMIIMTTIFMLALIFGIINTMLMAVLERMKELGMLMAIGMNKLRVFFMVVYETIFVSLIGAPLGMGLGYLTLQYLNYQGIDLSAWSKALEEFGMSDIVRPTLDSETYWLIGSAVVITAVLASIYPALKAIRLKPVEALRKI
ncbi:MAG: FtsX-like permease family protein [Saprospiraceae bacterium]|nr:FtsX-like permease family protein [Saprospiraceae bacterium]